MVFVLQSVVTVSSSLSQFFGFAIGMCVTIGGCVMGKISEGSLNPEHTAAAAFPWAASIQQVPLVSTYPVLTLGFVNHPIYMLFEVIGPALSVAFYWIARPA